MSFLPPPVTNVPVSNSPAPTNSQGQSPQANATNPSNQGPAVSGATVPTTATSTTTPAPTAAPATQRPPTAAATNTQKHVNALLKKFRPIGNRPKVVTLRDEMLKLKIKDNPIAFCFLLRSMFEISAKAYCDDKSLPTTVNNKEKTLAQLLTLVTSDLTNGNTNTAKVRILHGALAEITTQNRILSVTSMNQLVHSQTFSIQQSDICTLFNNIYPLLEAMN